MAEGLQKGMKEGRVEGVRHLLLRLGRKHLGAPDAVLQAELENLSDMARLEDLVERVTEVKTWAELLAQPGP